MTLKNRKRIPFVALSISLAGVLAVSACGTSSSSNAAEGEVTLSFLVSNSETDVKTAETLAEAYTAQNPDVTIEVETRPSGPDGVNVVKTRLVTDDMSDIFLFNTGSLLQTLNPAQTMLDLSEESYMDSFGENFIDSVLVDGAAYGVPLSSAQAGGFLYNTTVYEELGLEIPRTWDEFMDNSLAVKAAGKVGLIESFGTLFTSQLLVLGDFHNVLASNPDWATEYTENEAKYATDKVARAGFEHLAEVREAGIINEDYSSATLDDALLMLTSGEGAHYAILTGSLASIVANYPDQADEIGFFPIPGSNAADNGMTTWMPFAAFGAKSTEHPDEVRDFLAFVASPAGCDAMTLAVAPVGPYVVDGCGLPSDVLPAVADIQTYLDTPGASSLALEFLSPVKGPNLANILVAVGSGIITPEEGAAQYDDDVKKQALQLNLPGW